MNTLIHCVNFDFQRHYYNVVFENLIPNCIDLNSNYRSILKDFRSDCYYRDSDLLICIVYNVFLKNVSDHSRHFFNFYVGLWKHSIC